MERYPDGLFDAVAKNILLQYKKKRETVTFQIDKEALEIMERFEKRASLFEKRVGPWLNKQ